IQIGVSTQINSYTYLGITLFIDSIERAESDKPLLVYQWITEDEEAGLHTIEAVSSDEEGNTSSDKRVVELLVKLPPFTCGEPFTDLRDGREYNTVQIGSQCWMAENLNVGISIKYTHTSDNDTIEKYCIAYNEANCDIYGGLYVWDEAMAYSEEEGTRGICPRDWHIPTDAEWMTLEGSVDSQFGVGDLRSGRIRTAGVMMPAPV
ncbi:MAG: hypothetical protein IH594_13210, partial [Bacteroidales bacterium]|nr:hypothetical protein [Bacteroidales bacterium]